MGAMDETHEQRVERVIEAFRRVRPGTSFIVEYPELFRALAYLEAHSRVVPRPAPRRSWWRH